MREIQIRNLCDGCYADLEARTDATGVIAFTLDGRALRYDHCEAHDNPNWLDLIAQAHEDVEANGTAPKPAKPRKPIDVYLCPYCNQEMRGRNGIAMHVSLKHPAHKDNWREDLQEPIGAAPAPSTLDGPPFTCPECLRPCPSLTSLGVHRRRSHGVKGTGGKGERPHDGKRGYPAGSGYLPCPTCKREFTSERGLSMHIGRAHK